MDWKERISLAPHGCHGKAFFKGTTITVAEILVNLADGKTEDEILKRYAPITAEDIRAAISYAAELAKM